MLSLDATVVLLTPVVLAAAAHMRDPALPHAYAAGHLANSASLLLPVSNLTNLLAFATTGLSFLHFTGLMAGPWLVAVAVEYLVLRRLFRADLAVPVADPVGRCRPHRCCDHRRRSRRRRASGSPRGSASPRSGRPRSGCWCWRGGSSSAARARVGDLVRAADLPFALFVLGLAVVVLAVLRNGVEDVLHTVLPTGDALLATAGRRRRSRPCWPTC